MFNTFFEPESLAFLVVLIFIIFIGCYGEICCWRERKIFYDSLYINIQKELNIIIAMKKRRRLHKKRKLMRLPKRYMQRHL